MRMRRFATVLVASVLLCLFFSPAAATERVALVIGNADYDEAAADLRNPVNDATAVAAALRRLGFQVIEGTDLNEADFYDKIIAFDDAARAAEVALFFYAGHGLQVDGRNYLAPVDLKLERKQDLRRHAIELAAVLEVMRSETNLVILDACRNNPLAGELARSLGLSRAVAASRGLARVESVSGTLIAYATEPGSVAADGTGDNSPYTAALLAHLETPGLSVNDLFTQVTNSVLASTGGRQRPWTHSSMSRVVRLVASVDAEPSAALVTEEEANEPGPGRLAAEQELLFWESVKDSEDVAELQAYLDRYPDGAYEVLARNRLQALQGAAAPVSSPPAPSAERLESSLGLERSERRLIQLGLAAEGFDPGDADGLLGRKTRGAIGRWQASRGEEATGHLDVESAKLLMASGRERQAMVKIKERRVGSRFRDCPVCPDLVVVPAGSFLMGSPSGEEGRYDDEGPQHRVEISKPFAVGVHEVTRGEFGRFVRATGRSIDNSCRLWDSSAGKWVERTGRTWRDPGFAQTDRHPVVCVSWEDVRAYVRWLSRETGERYRLLSEAEWEYVARARTTEPFHTGSTISTDEANYDGSYTYKGVNRERTVPVGSFAANGFGLHDVHGNVQEWVEDCGNDSYRGAPADGRAWEREGCGVRVVRGGSWDNLPRLLRSAFRSGFGTGFRINDLGFRVSRTLTP